MVVLVDVEVRITFFAGVLLVAVFAWIVLPE